MPIVTVDPNEYERFELKSAPPDGYVMLRPLPYGMKLERRSKSMKTMMRSQPVKSRKQAMEQDNVLELDSQDEWAVAFDFSYCIGEHNLQNADGTLVDFASKGALWRKSLNPRVGSEIERLIDDLNNDEDDETLEDFLKRSATSSGDEQNLSTVGGNETQAHEEND